MTADTRPLVAVVDDDVSVRESLPALISESCCRARAFESAAELLASDCLADIRCLIVDVEMPGMSGLELLHKVKHRGYAIPIVFISGHRSAAVRQGLLDAGAAECLFKPLSFTELAGAIDLALRKA